MTDKVEQIRQEIERRYNLNRIGAHSAFRNGKCEALREVLDFIGSMSDKPKFKVGDTIRYRWAEKGDDWNKGTIIGIEDGKYLMKDGYVDIEHQDQWELVEEPKDKCNGCNNVKGCITCVDGSEWAHYEHVSEDLEAEIKRYVYDPYFNLNGVAVKGATEYLTVEDVADIARHFANWQKQQMMKDAKSGTVQKDYQVILDDGAYIDLDPSMQLKPSFAVKEGERVKLIIVRE